MPVEKIVTAGGAIEAILFQEEGAQPGQPDEKRNAQIDAVADYLAAFVRGASATLDLAVYDFRLDGSAADKVKSALRDRAGAGVAIRILFDSASAAGQGEEQGNDMTPGGTAEFLDQIRDVAQLKGITGLQPRHPDKHALMHDKYIIRDALSPAAAVLTGSSNFTNDAFGLQENNIAVLRSHDLASYYKTDFDNLWNAGEILPSSGLRDTGTVSIGGVPVTVAFAPGEGQSITREIVQAIDAAEEKITVASMLYSSGPILAALSEAIDRGITVEGVCDGTQMEGVVEQWRQSGIGEDKINTWEKVLGRLSAKPSIKYAPDVPHNFLHIKVLVADDTVVTGSFNFSNSARGNAENVLVIRDASLAAGYRAFIQSLVARYRR
ncbi:MAG: phosphatidylserine/phosphatidylglycerophosphate/cardiolipin synthase family protein [Rhodomicrobium sp.]